MLSLRPPTERTLVIVPDEETLLLCGQRISATPEVPEPGSEATALAGPSNQGTPRPSNISEAIKQTPPPWAQFSIVSSLWLALPLTAQVIHPVSSSIGFFAVE